MKFDLHDNEGEGINSTGLYTNGVRPTTPSTDLTGSGVNLHSGNPLRAHLTYDGTTLTVTVADTVTGASATQAYAVNLPALLGANTAFAGFTAGTGTTLTTQDILAWTFTPGAPAVVASPSFSPLGGSYYAGQAVTLGAAAGASIYYTLDGSVPSPSSTAYTAPFALNASATVRAIAVVNGAASPAASATYAITAVSGSPSLGGGFGAGTMVLNGSSGLSGSRLRLTDGKAYEAASAFYPVAVNAQSFTSDFTFQLTNASADGFMFVLQNQGATALGGYGIDLGYGGMTRSVGVKFDLYDNVGEGGNSTGLYTGGARPVTPSTDLTGSGVNLHSGNPLRAHLTYDGTTLTVTVADTVTGASATQAYAVNLPALLGANTAFAGFTAGTGGLAATQDILAWTFTPGAPAVVASPSFSPLGGSYYAGQAVTLGAAAGASIYYTLDGSVPSPSSTAYTAPFALNASATVRAIAVVNGAASPAASATYAITAVSGSPSLGGGFGAGTMVLNGSSGLSGSRLRLTDGKAYEAASAFYPVAVNAQSFTSDFTFQLTNASADGFMFVLQNQGATALGGYGIDLGYGGMTRSVGVKFDLYDNVGEGGNSTGLYTGGARPVTPSTDLTGSGVNLHSGNPLRAHLTYDGTTLTVTVADTVTGASATQAYAVNLPALLGANTAFAGFTAGTGGLAATQDILAWTFTPGAPAVVASPSFSPLGGSYYAGQAVTLGAAAGASIYYTLDGSVPSPSSTAYTAPFALNASATVRAIAVVNGAASPAASATYAITAVSGSPSLGGGFGAGTMVLNGSSGLSGSRLRLTDGKAYEAASAFYPVAVNAQSFTSDFTFQLTNASADGFMFVLQNQGATALGGYGIDLGYGGMTRSVGVKFDLYDNVGEGGNSTGLYTGGARPVTPSTDLTGSGVNLHSGNPLRAHLTYDGTTLTVTVADTVTGASATQAYAVNLPALLGANTAFAGFTAGTGGLAATQDILAWTFTPGAP